MSSHWFDAHLFEKSVLQLHFAFFVTQGISSQCNIQSSREGLCRSRQCGEAGGGRPSIFPVLEQSSVPSAVSKELAPEPRATWRASVSDKCIAVKTHLLEIMVES